MRGLLCNQISIPVMPSPPVAACLVSRPPDEVVGLRGRVKDKLGAGIDGALGENVLTNFPGLQVRDLDARVVADVDTVVHTVEARRVDASR